MSKYKTKEKRLRMLLEQFCKETEEGSWILPLSPSNIEIAFVDLPKDHESTLLFDIIHLDPDHDIQHLFPYYVMELWKIKKKRELGWKYWLYCIFNFLKFKQELTNKCNKATDWLYS